jgi:plastocyanin
MRRALATTALVAVAVGLVGGGSSWAATKKPVRLSGTVNVEGKADVSRSSDAELEMELDNFYFGPTFVKAKAGQTITLELENEGSAPHTFTSDALGVDEEVASGQSASVEITVPSSGKAFLFFCRFHDAAGMKGAVYVKKGAKVPSSG